MKIRWNILAIAGALLASLSANAVTLDLSPASSSVNLGDPVQTYAVNTHVNDLWETEPGGWGEWNLYDSTGGGGGTGIMEWIYGAGNFTRVDDAADIFWTEAVGRNGVIFDAVYAGSHQSLYLTRPDGTGATTAPGLAWSMSNTVNPPVRGASFISLPDIPSDPFLFADITPEFWSSSRSFNSDRRDHMVTFLVTGYLNTPGVPSTPDGITALTQPTYVIAFEDMEYGDYDYNDLVVEIHGVSLGVSVPEGGSALGLIAGSLVGWGLLRWRLRP